MKVNRSCLLFMAAAVSSLGGASTASASLIDFLISQDGSHHNMLLLQKPEIVFEPYPLDFVTDGPLAGYFASIEPGWDGLGVDYPDTGQYALLDGGHNIALQRVSFDSGFAMFDSLLNPILTSDGDTEVLFGENEGNPDLLWHEHLRFAIEPGAPQNTEYQVTFRITDLDGLHADSEEFTLTFVTVPEPASMLMLALTMIPVFASRRSR